jgi:BolA protein
MSVSEILKSKISDTFNPVQLEIIDESHMHAGHAGHDGSGESHFQVLIVSDAFEGVSRVQRQRLVYDLLAEELKTKIHALALKTLTPSEFEKLSSS